MILEAVPGERQRLQPDGGLVGGGKRVGPVATDSSTGTRYLGSKVRVAGLILDLIGAPLEGAVFIDAFAGTGVVAREAALRGWGVRLNDHLYSSSRLAAANVACVEHVPFRLLGGYDAALRDLNATPPIRGFIWREYSPVSTDHAPAERRYFTEVNAAMIDGMRSRIREWMEGGLLTEMEECLLIADLLVATNRVANTAGTFGCFLRRWNGNARQRIQVVPRGLLRSCVGVEILNREVFEVPSRPADVLYLDPPYTKRQYAAYYHILETVAHGDEPVVGGVTGLRPWHQKASPFCYRRKALRAIERVVAGSPAQRVYLSYSSEGHVELDALTEALGQLGKVQVHALGEIGRYAPNDQARERATMVTEYLVSLRKPAAHVMEDLL